MGGQEIHRHGFMEFTGWTPDPACRNGTCGVGFYRIISREDGSRGAWRWQRIYDPRHAHRVKITPADTDWRQVRVAIESTAPAILSRFVPKFCNGFTTVGRGAMRLDRKPVLGKWRPQKPEVTNGEK